MSDLARPILTSRDDTASGRLWQSQETVRLLDVEPELAAAAAGGPPLAGPSSIARVARLRAGAWDPEPTTSAAPRGVGLFLLDGLILRRAGWGARHGAELLGPGDVLRPWDPDPDGDGMLPICERWRVLEPARFAILDAAWAARMARWPEVFGVLTGRALARSRRAMALIALARVRQLDVRLWLLLWQLAQRHGRVRADGVHLELAITHQDLAELVGARRPSVSAALSRLRRTGRLAYAHGTWHLVGEPWPPPVATSEPGLG